MSWHLQEHANFDAEHAETLHAWDGGGPNSQHVEEVPGNGLLNMCSARLCADTARLAEFSMRKLIEAKQLICIVHQGAQCVSTPSLAVHVQQSSAAPCRALYRS